MNIDTGIYQVTQGEFLNAAILVVDVTQPDESEFVYISIYNPESQETHEIVLDEWLEMVQLDGLKRVSDIPDEIKDQLIKVSDGDLSDL